VTGSSRRPELRLFLAVFFVASALAAPAFGSCENRTLDLLRALSAGRLWIDPDSGNTVDRAIMPRPVPASFAALGAVAPARVVERQHLYSGGAPGHAFLLLAPYVVASRTLPARFLPLFLVLVGAALPLALAAVAVKRAAGMATGCTPDVATACGAIFALATIALPYGTRLYAHSITVACLAWSLALVLERPLPGRRAALAGLLAATAVACDYNVGIPAGVLLLLAVQGGRVRGALAFVVGALPAAIVLGAYHTACFGRPWETPYQHRDDEFALALLSTGFLGFSRPSPRVLGEILLGTRAGWLFTQPIAFAGLAGLVLGARRSLPFRLALLAISLALASHASRLLDWDGCAFGSRYSIATLPFLALGLPRGLELLGRWRWPVVLASAALASVGTSVDWLYIGTLPWNLRRIAITGPYTVLVSGPSRMTGAGALAAGLALSAVLALAYAIAAPKRSRAVLAALVLVPLLASVPSAVGLARGGQRAASQAILASYQSELAATLETEDNPYRLVNLADFARFLGSPGLESFARARLAHMSPEEKGERFLAYEAHWSNHR
jgi:hypothetical protein